MESWDRTSYSKVVKENTIQEFSFMYEGEKTIKEVKGSCSCFSPSFKGHIVYVKYKIKAIPFHLREQKKYTDGKTITVFFTDGTTDLLKFNFTVTAN